MNTIEIDKIDKLIDMHSHLDFACDYIKIAGEAQKAGIGTVCSTVTPSAFINASNALGLCATDSRVADSCATDSHVSHNSNAASNSPHNQFPSIFISLGLHPWWISNGIINESEIDKFEELIDETGFIGEIGLDLSTKHKDSFKQQNAILERALLAIKKSPNNHMITLHCVKSSNIVLDKLNSLDIFNNNDILFHWFSGTEGDFKKACSKNCYFSVGPKMLATKAGKRYAKMIPRDRLLLESDSPANEGSTWSKDLWIQELRNALNVLSEIRDEELISLNDAILENSNRLLKRYAF